MDKREILSPLWGTIAAYTITMAVFIIYALLLTYTDISEANSPALVLITMSATLIVGGIIAAHRAGQRGFLWGMATGALYVGIMIALGYFLIPGYTLGTKTLISLALGIGSGGLGGVIGVNVPG